MYEEGRESLAGSSTEVRERHEENRVAWNQGAQEYARSLDEAIAFLRAGGSNLHPIERAHLGDLRSWCGTAIHLQCASGKDTLSLWNEGVSQLIGVDISDVHIENARRMSEALAAPARWYRCDVLETPHELDGTSDLVYTGRGALCWILDIEGWARVIARLLKPGGVVHLLDDHPFTWFFQTETNALQLQPWTDYFEMAVADRGWSPTYLGDLGMPIEEHALKHERLWPLSSVVMALVAAGLSIEIVGEHREGYWIPFPDIPEEQLRRIPLTFSVMARKPEV